jgi:hypothetical protein
VGHFNGLWEVTALAANSTSADAATLMPRVASLLSRLLDPLVGVLTLAEHRLNYFATPAAVRAVPTEVVFKILHELQPKTF